VTVDLRTRYMGIELKNPLIAGPTPMTGKIDKLKELEEAGVAAVTLPSLFEEQISHDELQAAQMTDQGQFAEAWDFFPAMENYNTGPDSYLERLREAKKSCVSPCSRASTVTPRAAGFVTRR
jgi:dihydroorotate dehydrogenase (fumarate)